MLHYADKYLWCEWMRKLSVINYEMNEEWRKVVNLAYTKNSGDLQLTLTVLSTGTVYNLVVRFLDAIV